MSVLIVSEHDNTALRTATRNAVTAARRLSDDVHLLVAGNNCRAVADEAATIEGVSKVLLADAEHYAHPLAEALASLVVSVADAYQAVLAPATTFGKNLLPRAAALVDVAPISDVISIESEDTFVRPIYAGNALATVKSADAIKFLTIRTTAFDAAGDGGSATVEDLAPAEPFAGSRFVREELTKSERPDLTAAPVVISGGRGMQNAENFAMLERLADRLGGAVGASRAAVDAGYVPNDLQVGQTGKIVAPDLYIAVGISGAIQHLAGMKDSKVIVVINKDEEAPFFQVADYGIVGDLFQLVPELEAELDKPV